MKGLTGKAKEAFLKYVYYIEDTTQVNESIEVEILEEASCWLSNQDERFRYILIIEWLDSVDVFVEVGLYPNEDGDIYFSGVIFGRLGGWDDREYYDTRQQATEKAIEKAIEIYNERN